MLRSLSVANIYRIIMFVKYLYGRPNDYILATLQSAGTHWLRFMIAKAIVDHFGLDYEFKDIHPVEVVPGFSLKAPSQFLYNRRVEIPRVQHTHFPYKFPWSIFFHGKKSIVLVRDLRDALVSHYHKAQRQRDPEISGMSFLEFLRDRGKTVQRRSVQGSLEGRVEFLNTWGALHEKFPDKVLVIRYEELRARPSCELRKVLNFLGIQADETLVSQAVEFASIENMKLLARKALDSNRRQGLRQVMAVNKGQVGQFGELWNPEVDAYFRSYVSRHLRYNFGYSYD